MSSNRLWQLPASLCCCSTLRLLDCSHNQLLRLPEGVSRLSSLKSLKLTHNRWGMPRASTIFRNLLCGVAPASMATGMMHYLVWTRGAVHHGDHARASSVSEAVEVVRFNQVWRA